MTNNQITIQPSYEAGLSVELNGLQNSIYAAAERNLNASLAGDPTAGASLTQLERTALIEVEALKLVGSLDLTAILLRGRILAKIRNQNLLNVHPGGYQTLAQMAQEQGISAAELSNIETLCTVIFPYLETHGMSVAEIFSSVGKAKLFELVPIMSAIITGQMPGRGSTLDAVQAILEGSTNALRADGIESPTSDQIVEHAVDRLIEIGTTLPVREMRRQVRPSHTPDLEGVMIRQGDQYFAVLRMDEDQRLMFERLTNRHTNITISDIRPEIEPHVGSIRRLLGA